jgi:hypothetical protein
LTNLKENVTQVYTMGILYSITDTLHRRIQKGGGRRMDAYHFGGGFIRKREVRAIGQCCIIVNPLFDSSTTDHF